MVKCAKLKCLAVLASSSDSRFKVPTFVNAQAGISIIAHVDKRALAIHGTEVYVGAR